MPLAKLFEAELKKVDITWETENLYIDGELVGFRSCAVTAGSYRKIAETLAGVAQEFYKEVPCPK